MANQFDLEQGIMECWNVTSELDLLLEELMENSEFTQDQASNFVLGLSTIYEAKFEKLFRTFEGFLKEYYRMRKVYEDSLNELDHLREEAELAEEANLTLEEILDENDNLNNTIEDEFSVT
jgi:hypothetical protein